MSGTRRLLRLVAFVCIWSITLAMMQGSVKADQTDESSTGGSRTIESGPSIAAMEKESGAADWSYNTEYLFGLSKHVRDSSMPSGAKEIVFVFAFLVDIPLLPFAAIAGLFGE